MLNAIFFAWQYQKENHTPVNTEKELISGNADDRLVLLSELDAVPASETIQPAETDQDKASDQLPAVESEPEPEEIPTFICYTIGPITDISSATELSSMLSGAGVTAVTRETEDKKHNGYWVHLPVEESLSSARQIVQELKVRKITDISIVPLEGSRYVISLGVFSEERRAKRRHDQFQSLGYVPLIEDRYSTTTRIWIDVKDNDPSILPPEVWQNLVDKFPGIRHQGNAC